MFDRKKAVAFLTTNCACWKGKDKALEAFQDDEVKQLVDNARVVLVVNQYRKGGVASLTRNAADGEGEAAGVDIKALAELFGIATDPGSDPAAFIAELKAKLDEVSAKLGGAAPEPAPEEEPVAMEESEEERKKREEAKKMATNRRPAPQKSEAERNREYYRNAPPLIRRLIDRSVQSERREKEMLVNRLTAHLDDDVREAKAKSLMAKDVDALQEMAELLPTANGEPDILTANYFGAAGAPVLNGRDDSQNLLPDFTANREEEEEAGRRKQRA